MRPIPFLLRDNKLYMMAGTELNKQPSYQVVEALQRGYLVTSMLAKIQGLVTIRNLTYIPFERVTSDEKEFIKSRR